MPLPADGVPSKISAMANRVHVLWALGLLSLGAFNAGASEPPTDQASGTALQIEEIIRQASDALDRLESISDHDRQQQGLPAVEDRIALLRAEDPANPWLLYLVGRAYAIGGRGPDAAEQLRKFVETRAGRNEWGAYKILGDLFAESFPRLAKANYDKAVALKPNEPSLLLGLSVCDLKLGYNEKALEHAQQAVAADKAGGVAYVTQLAKVFAALGRRNEAETEAASALKLAQKSMRDHPGERDAVARVNTQHDLLIDILEARVRTTPQDATLYLRLADQQRQRAETSSMLARYDALAVLETGIANTAPDPPLPLLERFAVELAELGRFDEARTRFQEILAKVPDNNIAQVWLDRLQSEGAPVEPGHQP